MAQARPYDAATRLIHLLLASLGICALVSGQFADDYRRALHPGFEVHRWIGIALAAALAARLVWGFVGPRAMRFSQWLPISSSRLRACGEDLVWLARLRLPVREGHEGLAGLVQAVGLAAFAWMAATGTLLWIYLEPGTRAAGWVRAVKELHEGGQAIAIGYVVVHAGAVLVHSLAGHAVWRRMAPWPGGNA